MIKCCSIEIVFVGLIVASLLCQVGNRAIHASILAGKRRSFVVLALHEVFFLALFALHKIVDLHADLSLDLVTEALTVIEQSLHGLLLVVNIIFDVGCVRSVS